MKFSVMIPARIGSLRMKNKPLQMILGKPMVEHVYLRAKEAQPARVIIATDDQKIYSVAKDFGAEVVMTATHHASGTERIAEVVELLELDDEEIIVNLQGDEPCMPGALIRQTANLLDDMAIDMATLAMPLTSIHDINNPNIVKVVLNQKQFAMYFSRATIPYDREGLVSSNLSADMTTSAYLKHIGIYAYRVKFIKEFGQLQASPEEKLEKLEQLRALWHGYKIKVGLASVPIGPGVDTMEELKVAEAWLSRLNQN